MSDLPIVITQSGAQPTPPKTLLSNLITNVAAIVPGYTANLPAALIADLAGTATGAVALIDSAMVDTINSVTPYGANLPMLMQLGTLYGVPQGKGYNTSVNVTFIGLPGFVIPKGFIVSDGNYQYMVQNNAVVPAGGQTKPIYCLATTGGCWAVPAGSVTQIITSVPSTITLSCTNVTAGVPGAEKQPESSYRAQVMQAGMVTAQGVPAFLKTLLQKVSGVKSNLISYRNVSTGRWALIVGGGDPYEVGLAVYSAVPDISVLTADVLDGEGNKPDSITVTITDYPDNYNIPVILPTSQMASVILTWNIRVADQLDPDSASAAAIAPLVDYINDIPIGEPINTYQIESIFLTAITSLVSPTQISLIDISIGINGVVVPPLTGTELIYGGEYSYFTTDPSRITVQRYGNTD
ncbi:baseplate J/gp47 family protein [Erwiniaceae bacterium BAC15a-03b]|uniref:Baseplate J/gp47 family protein n=1 Tax=Winslowiella arboricola TaxID=2978220 RepID=A0A9J6PYY7_9GAMM|nr:baseplate J/gp47 family protein [Winslowiella arboricola]MCU5774732.1 baseplate J/gp47 family protein [Winslowiella arboricola]MCU5780116.1 baseplate J/gp47 family protein [Winslowiella arboricola]